MYQKKFTLAIDVKEFPDGGHTTSVPVNHFGLPWYLRLERKEEHLDVFLWSTRKKNVEKPWSVYATFQFRLTSATGEIKKRWTLWYTFGTGKGFGKPKFVSWKDAMEDGESKIVCEVTISRTTGLATKRYRSFDVTTKCLTDVVIIVEDKKFNVLKGLLAIHSSYFHGMFFGVYSDAIKKKFKLKGIHSDAFHWFLEVLYGEFEIGAYNVADLLNLAEIEKLDSYLVRNKCEEFLLKSDEVDKKQKLILAETFKLDKLMNQCLESMTSIEEFEAYLPEDLTEFSTHTMISIVKKSLLHVE